MTDPGVGAGAPGERWDPTMWDVAGPADGPPLVFLHGAVMTRAQWRPQVDRLANAGFRCIAVDLPGHGALADRPFTIEAATSLVADVVDRVAGGRAVIIGLSLGGFVAMTVAGGSPERVRGLVLAGATAEPRGPIVAGFAAVAWTLRLVPEVMLRAVVTWQFHRRYGPAVATAILANGYYARGGSLAIRRLLGGRFRDRLDAYGGPVLAINGDRDVVFRLGERRFLEGLPEVKRLRLRRAAHLSNLDRPAEFAAAVAAFSEGLPA